MPVLGRIQDDLLAAFQLTEKVVLLTTGRSGRQRYGAKSPGARKLGHLKLNREPYANALDPPPSTLHACQEPGRPQAGRSHYA